METPTEYRLSSFDYLGVKVAMEETWKKLERHWKKLALTVIDNSSPTRESMVEVPFHGNNVKLGENLGQLCLGHQTFLYLDL